MSFAHKFIKRQAGSEKGFVLIVAIMAIVIMIAVGFFALTVISGDMMITYRLASERRAFSAAESGVHAVFTSLNLNNLAISNVNNVQIDPRDPDLTYSAITQETNQRVAVAGFDPSSMAQIYQTVVTGRNNSDASMVNITIGVTPPPTQADTQQGRL